MRLLLVLIFLPFLAYSQADVNRFYALCLDANVSQAMQYLPPELAPEFEKRFKYADDQSDYLAKRTSGIDSLLSIFHNYWRKSLLDSTRNYDNELGTALNQFFHTAPTTPIDSLQAIFNAYIKAKNFFATDGIGKVGRLYDLLVWRKQTDTAYSFHINKEHLQVRVVLMQNFVSLGWEDYATLGKHYPGGWAVTDALYCVSDAYDKNSEKFLVSYLAHEGRHLQDYKLFPGINGKDLEYRAKLTELSMADSTLFPLIKFFIVNANKKSGNDHNIADFHVISDLSQTLFHKEFEDDITKWKQLPVKTINQTAYQLLNKHAIAMRSLYNAKKDDKKKKEG